MLAGLEIQPEALVDVIGELDSVLYDYWKSTDAHKGVPPLAMDWWALQRLEAANAFVCLVARQQQQVLGFVQYMLFMHLHHKTTRFGHCDILAVRPMHRGKGVGRALIKAGEVELRRRGVKRIVHAQRSVYDVPPLFPKLGYTATETVYMKAL